MATLNSIMLDDGSFRSEMEVPNGRDPEQNAWLTLTLRYQLVFADLSNKVPGVIVQHGGHWWAKDADGTRHPFREWDAASRQKFRTAFQRGENIWNWQFVLITPQDFDALDYTSMGGPGWVVRPNVLCLFRLQEGGAAHKRITVVRMTAPVTSNKTFRSHESLYDDLDVWTPTLGHELGHALGMGHIKDLTGDAQCIANAKLGVFPDRCYGETPVEKANIMGGGGAVYLLNAKPWLERAAHHSGRPAAQWKPTGVMTTPTRKIPLGLGQLHKPPAF